MLEHKLDKRLKPVRDVTRGIRTLESNCDAVVAGAAQLVMDVLEASAACELAPGAAQEALERVGKVFTAGIHSRALSVSAHDALLEVARNPSVPMGWGDFCPGTGAPPSANGVEAPVLSLVG